MVYKVFNQLSKIEENNTKLRDASFTLVDALDAILARIDGVWDNKSLMEYGPLSIHAEDDIRRIAFSALGKVRKLCK